MEGDLIGGCCIAIFGAFQQFFNTKQWGMDWKCCDNCCRCECCWDEGEFDPNDRPGASQQQEVENGPKMTAGVERQSQVGDEELPAYKPSEGMTIPAAAPQTQVTDPIFPQT